MAVNLVPNTVRHSYIHTISRSHLGSSNYVAILAQAFLAQAIFSAFAAGGRRGGWHCSRVAGRLSK